MQRSWRNDTDKLTFIICLPSQTTATVTTPERCSIVAQRDDASHLMVGDINLFLYDDGEAEAEVKSCEGSNGITGCLGKKQLVGEVELMIARKEWQGQGLGRAAVLLFLWYIAAHKEDIVAAHCGSSSAGVLRYLSAKIHESNVRSIGLFESLLFRKKSEAPNYFGEMELVLEDLDSVKLDELMKRYGLEGGNKLKYEEL